MNCAAGTIAFSFQQSAFSKVDALVNSRYLENGESNVGQAPSPVRDSRGRLSYINMVTPRQHLWFERMFP
jgi:hypothetical protein